MTNEDIVKQLSDFRHSLKIVEKRYENDDKYASISKQIENVVVDMTVLENDQDT